MSDEFNFSSEVMEQLRELNRRVGDIATTQAAQPTRADLQNYVLTAVFDVIVDELRKKDQDQQSELEDLKKSVQGQVQRWIQQGGVIVALLLGLIALLKVFLPH